MIDFIKFNAATTTWFFLAGFVFTSVLFFAFGHANNAPVILQGVVTAFDLLTCLFGIVTLVAVFLLICRSIGRAIVGLTRRALFA